MPRPPGLTASPNRAPAPRGAGGGPSSSLLEICAPDGVVSTMRPLLPLTVRMSPFGAIASPGGPLSLPPDVTVAPGPALPDRTSACATAVIVLFCVFAMYSQSRRPSPTPVGPSTNADAFCCSARPDATLVVATHWGARPRRSTRVRRRTVPWWTTDMVCWTPPFSTLVTNRWAIRPCSAMVESHGPLIPCPRNVSAILPLRLSTIRQPALALAAIPLLDGVLPTTTQPPLSTSRAVGRPTPPGHRPATCRLKMCANCVR